MFQWSDDSALYTLMNAHISHGPRVKSAELYVRARMNGKDQTEANEDANDLQLRH